MAKVLVTGASGFLGGWLSEALHSAGHEVSVLVRTANPSAFGKDIRLHKGDVTDTDSLLRAFNDQEAVFHLAGLIAYRKVDRPKMDLINVQGTANVITACKQQKVAKLIHVSSVAAIGASFSADQILNENSPYNLEHLNLGYFETKRLSEKLVVTAVQKNEIDAVILNPSTIYGKGDAKKGSRGTQLKVAQGKFPFYTNGGVNVVAVEDVVAGLISAWKKGRSGERYILASENLLIQNLLKLIAECAGTRPPHLLMPNFVLHGMGFLGDALQSLGISKGTSRERAYASTLFHFFDNSKAVQELDFKPKPAKIAIQNSVQWMRENGLLG